MPWDPKAENRVVPVGVTPSPVDVAPSVFVSPSCIVDFVGEDVVTDGPLTAKHSSAEPSVDGL